MDSAHDLNALFSREPSGLSFPGPFRVHEVVLHEHQVPFLHALPREDGGIHLRLDDRFTLDLDVAEAERFIPFLADAIAVALGYVFPPRPECAQPRRKSFTRMLRVTTAQSDRDA